MFFLEMLGPLLNLPEAVVSLSVFHVYGRPGVQPVNWGGIWALAGVAAFLGALGLAGVTRRDITK
jgi:putative exporter of polyketide antibiotics